MVRPNYVQTMECMPCITFTSAFSHYHLCLLPPGVLDGGGGAGGAGEARQGACVYVDSACNDRSDIMPHPRVASLHVYPVKGCKGIDVEAAYFERTGKLAGRDLACRISAVCLCTRSSGNTGAQVWHTIAHGWWSERKRGNSLRSGSTPSLSKLSLGGYSTFKH